MALLQSPVHERHEKLGAKFAEFGGWSMPLEYAGGGVLAEHAAVREAVGVFDVSHLGKAVVAGKDAVGFLNSVLTNDLTKVHPGKAQYNLLCQADGGVTDDLICYLKSDDEVFLIPNAANTGTVCQILAEHAPEGITVTNQHLDHAVFAVQGPRSEQVLTDLGLPTDLEYMAFAVVDAQWGPMTVCRTGYTGEKGYELVIGTGRAAELWDAVMAAGQQYGIRACGLGARDTLRTEMGYSLHGNDISPQIDPVSAGLSWAIGWGKPDFLGHQALRAIKEAGPARRNRALRALGRGIARHGMTVVDPADGSGIGEVTSGTFSPTLRVGIALAQVDSRIKLGDTVGVQVRNRVEQFEVVKPPFVKTDVRD